MTNAVQTAPSAAPKVPDGRADTSTPQPCVAPPVGVSRELDTSRIEAQLRDGVLRLTLPKAEAARPRRIQVQAG